MFECSLNIGDSNSEDDYVVASVNSENLYFSSLVNQFPHLSDASEEVIAQYADRWIEQKIILDYIYSTNFHKKPEIREELKTVKERFLLVKFKDYLAEDVKEISTDEINSFYSDYKEIYIIDETGYKYEIIFFRDRNTANTIYKTVTENNSFSLPTYLATELVQRELSQSFVKENEMAPKILDIISSMKIGEISKPFPIDNMHAIARLNDRREKGDYLKIDDVRNFITIKLINEKKERALASVIDSLLVFYKIENYHNGAFK